MANEAGILGTVSNTKAPSGNVADWYDGTAGKVSSQAGLDFWNGQLKDATTAGRSVDDVYKGFLQGVQETNAKFMPDTKPVTPANNGTIATPQAADVANWYKSVLGRDADPAGIAFWNQQLASAGAAGKTSNDVYNGFVQAAGENKERLSAPQTQAQANNYTGPISSNASTTVDEWGKNVLGRQLTTAETTQWNAALGAAKTPAAISAVYNSFLTSFGPQVKNNMDMASASQIKADSNNPVTSALATQSGVVAPLATTTLNMPTAPEKLQAPTEGILNRSMAMPTSSVAGTSYNSSQVDPEKAAQWKVEDNQTAQFHMKNMIDPNSTYYQTWKNAGANDAAARGFTGNDSIRQSGILDSVARNASPIAMNDANVYAKSASYNADIKNQMTLSNQRAANDASQFAASSAAQAAIASLSAETARYQASLAADTSKYNTDQNNKYQAYESDSRNQESRYGTNVSAATSKYNTDSQNAISRYNTDLNNATSRDNNAATNATTRDVAAGNNATTLANTGLQTESQQLVSRAQLDNANLIATNDSAKQLYRDFSATVMNILAKPDTEMDEASKSAAIAQAKKLFDTNIGAVKDGSYKSPDLITAQSNGGGNGDTATGLGDEVSEGDYHYEPITDKDGNPTNGLKKVKNTDTGVMGPANPIENTGG